MKDRRMQVNDLKELSRRLQTLEWRVGMVLWHKSGQGGALCGVHLARLRSEHMATYQLKARPISTFGGQNCSASSHVGGWGLSESNKLRHN